jgi:hypothetical protein
VIGDTKEASDAATRADKRGGFGALVADELGRSRAGILRPFLP